jgi:hypothetical protein
MEIKIFFSPWKNVIFKIISKRNPKSFKILYNSIITNLKFQTQAKIIIFQKSSYKIK